MAISPVPLGLRDPPVRDKLYGPAVVVVVGVEVGGEGGLANRNVNVLQKSPPPFHGQQPGEFKVFMEPE